LAVGDLHFGLGIERRQHNAASNRHQRRGAASATATGLAEGSAATTTTVDAAATAAASSAPVLTSVASCTSDSKLTFAAVTVSARAAGASGGLRAGAPTVIFSRGEFTGRARGAANSPG
jgi:hypothetical protein